MLVGEGEVEEELLCSGVNSVFSSVLISVSKLRLVSVVNFGDFAGEFG